MKENDTYYITYILDPRIKTKWLIKNVADVPSVISRIRTTEPILPRIRDLDRVQSLEY